MHTPIPWIIKHVQSAAPEITGNSPEYGPRRICKVLYDPGSEDAEVMSNARFIVTACNSHYELLEELQTFINVHAIGGFIEPNPSVILQAQEIIAKATDRLL